MVVGAAGALNLAEVVPERPDGVGDAAKLLVELAHLGEDVLAPCLDAFEVHYRQGEVRRPLLVVCDLAPQCRALLGNSLKAGGAFRKLGRRLLYLVDLLKVEPAHALRFEELRKLCDAVGALLHLPGHLGVEVSVFLAQRQKLRVYRGNSVDAAADGLRVRRHRRALCANGSRQLALLDFLVRGVYAKRGVVASLV